MTDPDELRIDGPDLAPRTVVLAHGAGAPMDSPFMDQVARGLALQGLRVVRFEFPYMQRRRRGQPSGPPDPQRVLEQRWQSVIEQHGDPRRLVIGGKSLGGRIASHVADTAGVAGLICLGYPFHPPRVPERLRTSHLRELETPSLIVQGTRDPFGGREEIAGYLLSSKIRLHFIEDGDHSFKPSAKSGRTLERNLADAIDAAGRFVENL